VTDRHWIGIGIGASGAVLILFVWFALRHVFEDSDFGSVAVLILVGLAAFIAIMNVLTFSAYLVKIIDVKEPFGLPNGTVRAILTIAFIVLVGVLASFLLTNSSERTPYSGTPITVKVTKNQLDDKIKELSASGIVSVEQLGTDNTPATLQFFPRQDYRLADDVAKQILTMLSTILAAMIGFYFGAQTPSTASSSSESQERESAKKDLEGLAAQAQAVRKAADDKVNADAAKQPTIDPIKASLKGIDDKIAAARTAADDTSVPIERVRSALTDAKTAAAALDELKRKIDAA
jgi:hypothetical protein